MQLPKKALITGISGQDGSYLAEHLLEMNYEVFGIVRRLSTAEHQTYRNEKILKKLNVFYADLLDELSYDINNKAHFGGEGLVSTFDDYSNFCAMLLNGGKFNGSRIISKSSIEMMTKKYSDGDDVSFYYGFSVFVLGDPGKDGRNSSKGIFGTGVSVALDPRSLGTQIDDSIMQKNLSARILMLDRKYFLSIKSKVLDGRIFLTGKVDNPEEKLKITKLAWETEGARSVRNDIKIKEKFNFQQSAKDLLITSQLRTALIINKQVKATNYQIDTYKKKVYVYGIALTSDEKLLVIQEAKEVIDVEDVIASILLVEDLRIQKN